LKRDDRAALADLRRGLGKEPGTALEMFPYIARFLNDSRRTNENAIFLLASLFGLYPKVSWRSDEKGRRNLGSSMSFLKGESASIEHRFVALLNSDEEDLSNHLRQIVGLLKSKEVPIDWNEMLRGIKQWNRSDRKIQREWAKGFWGTSITDNTDEGEQQQ